MYHYALVIYCGDNLVNKKKKNMFGTCETRSVLYIRWHLLTTGLVQSWSPSSDGGQMRGNITCQWEMKRLRVRYETEFINSGVSYIGAWCQHTSLLVFSFTTQWIFAVSLPLFMSFFPFGVSAPVFLFLELLKYRGILHSSPFPLLHLLHLPPFQLNVTSPAPLRQVDSL